MLDHGEAHAVDAQRFAKADQRTHLMKNVCDRADDRQDRLILNRYPVAAGRVKAKALDGEPAAARVERPDPGGSVNRTGRYPALRADGNEQFDDALLLGTAALGGIVVYSRLHCLWDGFEPDLWKHIHGPRCFGDRSDAGRGNQNDENRSSQCHQCPDFGSTMM